MGALEIIFGIVLLVLALGIVAVVLFQQGHQHNLGAITGGADTFLSKNKARSVDAMLEKYTKYVAIAFFAIVILINVVIYFAK